MHGSSFTFHIFDVDMTYHYCENFPLIMYLLYYSLVKVNRRGLFETVRVMKSLQTAMKNININYTMHVHSYVSRKPHTPREIEGCGLQE